jgi:hypothetical protein
MLRFRLAPIVAAICIVLCSCQKEVQSELQGPGSRLKMIRSKWYDSLFYRSFQYDSQGRLSAVLDSNNNGYKQTFYISYDGQGKLWKVMATANGSSVDNTYIFEYDDKGRIVKKSRFPIGRQTGTIENSFSYDVQGRIAADSIYSYWTQQVYRIVSYSYDQKSNVVGLKAVDKGSGAVVIQQQCDYDNHPNPFSNLEILFYLYSTEYDLPVGNNNLIKERYDDGTIVDYTFEYSGNGLPQKFSFTDNTDPSITYVEYYYE